MGWRFDSRFQPTVDLIDFLLFMVSVLFHDKKSVWSNGTGILLCRF